MRITAAVLFVGVVAATVGSVAGPAFATTPTPAAATPPRTVASVKARVDAKAAHITSKLQALQGRLATRPNLDKAKATLQADITKALADTDTWRKQVDAATTMDAINAANSAHQTVKADLAKLHADLAAAKGATKTA